MHVVRIERARDILSETLQEKVTYSNDTKLTCGFIVFVSARNVF